MASPKNAVAFERQRHYEWQGEKLPSVTTILNAYPKPWLGAWAAKMVATTAVNDHFDALSDDLNGRDSWLDMSGEEAIRYLKGSPWRKRDTAADFGTAVHEALAQLVAEQPITAPEGTERHVAALHEWWDAYRPHVLDSEIQVFAPEAGYAGSLDAIADVYGRRLLLDLKTGSTKAIAEWGMQLAAYRYAELIGEDDRRIAAVPEVDACAVLWIPRDTPEDWQFMEVEAGAVEYVQFLRLLGTHRYVKAKEKADGTLILPQEVQVA